jgi:hypothetical protein
MIKYLLLLFITSSLAYEIKPGSISVSGISSGAHFAAQFHLSHSDKVNGVALIAGGPYYCSYFSITKALYNCMEGMGAVNTEDLVRYTQYLSLSNLIASNQNIEDDHVFLLAGKNDQTVVPAITKSNSEFYTGLGVKEENIKIVDNLNIGHAFPTENYGNPCDTKQASPFINACNYDGAKHILDTFYDLKNKKTKAIAKNLVTFSQQPFSSFNVLLSSLSLGNEGFAYIPTKCQEGEPCSLHISFHGCEMSASTIGDTFVKYAGFNQWAESNDIIILYPQTVKNVMLGNPHGCWDWWGYTGVHFGNRYGLQIQVVNKILERFTDPSYRI